MNNTEIPWLQYVKQSLIEALAAMFLFWIIYAGYRVEFIRSLAGDSAFSILNLVSSSEELTDVNNTAIKVYTIDKTYFKQQGLLDQNGETNYGQAFPRSKLAEIISIFDELPADKQPISLFLDYSMEDGTASYDNNQTIANISRDDMVFLEQLSKKRNYKILLPKESINNFVERYAMESKSLLAGKIAKQIKKESIIFVDVNFLNSDTRAYRYNPMKKYSNNDKIYLNASLVNWQLMKHGYVDMQDVNNSYRFEIFSDSKEVLRHGAALFKSNIITKSEKEIKRRVRDTNSSLEKGSYWSNLTFNSVAVLSGVNRNKQENFHDTLVMVGVSFKDRDIHTNNIGENDTGISIHANATKTILFLDGSLDRVGIANGFMMIFVIFFTATLLSRYVLTKVSRRVKRVIELSILSLLILAITFILFTGYDASWIWILFLIVGAVAIFVYNHFVQTAILFNISFELLLLVGMMMYASYYFLIEYHSWFNWFIPILIFYIDDLVIVWREYREMAINRKEKSV